MKGKQVVNFLSYIAVALIAVALILGKIFAAFGLSSSLVGAMSLIAQIIAYAIVAVYAYSYARSRKHIGWMIAYIIFVIAIIVFLVLGI